MGYPKKSKIMIVLIILSTLAVLIFHNIKEIRSLLESKHSDKYSRYVKQFDEIRTMLPSHGFVSYHTDGKFSAKWFYLTQYALAPVFVIRNAESKFVIGVFRNHKNRMKYCRRNNLVYVQTIGGNIVLLRRELK